MDEFDLAHMGSYKLSNETWLPGPVILLWRDTQHAVEQGGDNLVIHEFVHKNRYAQWSNQWFSADAT